MTLPFKKQIRNFLSKDKYLPLIAGLASGLYPWAFYYTNNFNFVNSWDHFFFFLTRFVLFPTVVYYLYYFVMRKKHLHLYTTIVLPFLNALTFFTLVMYALYASVGYKKVALVIVLAVLVAILTRLVKNLFSKLLVIQFLLLITTAYLLAVIAKQYLFYSEDWLKQPDAIEQVVFKKTPNIYVIQPDGYTNFSELGKGFYNFDNSKFELWLQENNFVLYPDFRSNYNSTLHSNSSLFAMKHHHYDVLDERKVIFDKNPVVAIFKNNGYKTHFLAEVPYLLTNLPKINFDYTNFKLKDIPYLSKGLDSHRVILEDFSEIAKEATGKNFYFFEKLLPGHITTYKDQAESNEAERERYLENLVHANDWLQKLIQNITENDPEGLIVIVADHGGFVGLKYSLQSNTYTTNRDNIYTIFSAALAIKWPENSPPEFDDSFKSSVNLFRILFAYLGEDLSLLKNLQDDTSYIQIKEGAPKGVYGYIDGDGNIILKEIK